MFSTRLHLVALCLFLFSAVSAAQRPNVVIFVIDDVADSDIDSIRTPTLNRLASQGVRFRRAYSHAWCAPTRDALMRSTWHGRWFKNDCSPSSPQATGYRDFNIVKLFESAGYSTAHFGKWHMGSNPVGPWEVTPHLFGYDNVRAGLPIGNCSSSTGWLRVDDGTTSVERTHTTIAIRNATINWWKATEGPKFAMVNFIAAHSPFNVPPRSILYPWVSEFIFDNRGKFEAEVIGVDFVLNQILNVIGDDTWVIFIGDNGTPGRLPNKPLSKTSATRPDQDPDRVKMSCYEDGVRIPFIFRAPGIPAGVESQALVHVVDILPTLAEGLHLTVPEEIDGVSFAPALMGGGSARDFVYVSSLTRLDNAIITPRWKLLVNSSGVEELYDLELDPRERRPLSPTNDIAQRLRHMRRRIENGAP